LDPIGISRSIPHADDTPDNELRVGALMRIRVVLAHMPPMLRDIIHGAVMNERDVEIVGAIEEEEPFLPALASIATDVLILGRVPPDDLGLAKQVWEKWPRIRVLTIAQGGRSAVLHVATGDVSPQGLVAAIRGVPTW
jgi:DNA-binding NarL/FixJ family response regulator